MLYCKLAMLSNFKYLVPFDFPRFIYLFLGPVPITICMRQSQGGFRGIFKLGFLFALTLNG